MPRPVSATKVETPERLLVDQEKWSCQCIDDWMDPEDESTPYVDVRIDTIPLRDGDPDFSENPDLLRKTAAWLVRAAEWLEKRQLEIACAVEDAKVRKRGPKPKEAGAVGAKT